MNKEKIMSGVLVVANILSFLGLVMSVVIKTRILLGISNKIDAKGE